MNCILHWQCQNRYIILYSKEKKIIFCRKARTKIPFNHHLHKNLESRMTYPLSLQALRHLFPAQLNSLVLNGFLYWNWSLLIPGIMCSPSFKGNRWTLAMTGHNWKSMYSGHQFPINMLKCLFFKNNNLAWIWSLSQISVIDAPWNLNDSESADSRDI